jgi:hypothetical protein
MPKVDPNWLPLWLIIGGVSLFLLMVLIPIGITLAAPKPQDEYKYCYTTTRKISLKEAFKLPFSDGPGSVTMTCVLK